MSEYREKRTVIEDVPIGRRPVVQAQYDSVVHERTGMSGGAIAALVVAAITAAVVIAMLIFNSQQHDNDEELAQERARTAAAQHQAGQPSQQPVIVTVPSSQPVAVPVPYPVPAASQPAATETAPSSTQIEIDVNSKLLDDQDLRSVPVDVKVSGGIATLSGRVSNEDLKMRAEKLAMTVKGVRGTINNIIVLQL